MEAKEFEEFHLKDRKEVKTFQYMLDRYLHSKTKMEKPYINLLDIYDALKGYKNEQQLFTMFLDLKINLVLLDVDIAQSGGIWNGLFTKGKLEGGSVLDSKIKFFGKMEIHRYNTSYIFRYRAIWDKLMGILILLYLPDDYKSFTNSKSKKRAFKRIAKKSPNFEDGFVDSLIDALTKFDNELRTPEAHKTGRLRKFSFTMNADHENPSFQLFGYANMLLDIIRKIDDVFKQNK